MAKRWTRTECFSHFGAAGANPRWSWSGRSTDGETVVITLWQDKLKRRPDGTWIYVDHDDRGHDWTRRPGNSERLEHLKHAVDNLGGLFRVVVAKAKDVDASHGAIEDCFPQPNLIMKIIELDRETGEFTASGPN